MGELARVAAGALVLLEGVAHTGASRLGLVTSSAGGAGGTGALGLVTGSGGGGGGGIALSTLLLGSAIAAEAGDLAGLSALLAANGLVLELLGAVELLLSGSEHPVLVALLLMSYVNIHDSNSLSGRILTNSEPI